MLSFFKHLTTYLNLVLHLHILRKENDLTIV